jgi:transposase
MDNLAVHKSARARELVEARGCELLFLPPHSPDLNPIEGAFSKMKSLLRRIGARTRETLMEVMRRAICAVTTRDALEFSEHCGYRIAS